MGRQVCVLLALLALLWNGVAGPMVRTLADAVTHDDGHVALHLNHVKHHHDGAGYHVDDSAPSIVHLSADVFPANVAIVSLAVGIEWPKRGSTPPEFLSRTLPSPDLPHFLRPPRSL